jgi:hypothetical protein
VSFPANISFIRIPLYPRILTLSVARPYSRFARRKTQTPPSTPSVTQLSIRITPITAPPPPNQTPTSVTHNTQIPNPTDPSTSPTSTASTTTSTPATTPTFPHRPASHPHNPRTSPHPSPSTTQKWTSPPTAPTTQAQQQYPPNPAAARLPTPPTPPPPAPPPISLTAHLPSQASTPSPLRPRSPFPYTTAAWNPHPRTRLHPTRIT